MGQYYQAILIHDGRPVVFDPHRYGAFSKLMEHSWVESGFVNSVMEELYNTPKRVVWMGDYADGVAGEAVGLGNGFIKNKKFFMKLYDLAWNCDDEAESPIFDRPYSLQQVDYKHCCLVNVTQRLYIDMEYYIRENSYSPDWSKDDAPWCIAPLPLLTAVSNGLGGGDFFGKTGSTLVRSWAFDEIMVTDSPPEGYTEAEEIKFKED